MYKKYLSSTGIDSYSFHLSLSLSHLFNQAKEEQQHCIISFDLPTHIKAMLLLPYTRNLLDHIKHHNQKAIRLVNSRSPTLNYQLLSNTHRCIVLLYVFFFFATVAWNLTYNYIHHISIIYIYMHYIFRITVLNYASQVLSQAVNWQSC